jgi:flagellar biosynthesis/type III secretory pathway protein FliH
MPVNSISPNQQLHYARIAKKTELAAARKQVELQEANKVKDKKDAAERQAQLQNQQLQKAQETGKAAGYASGQQTGTRINTSA